jgi:hypothetical protein
VKSEKVEIRKDGNGMLGLSCPSVRLQGASDLDIHSIQHGLHAKALRAHRKQLPGDGLSISEKYLIQ